MLRQLRWRLVGAQIAVVLVGVIVLAVAAQLSLRAVPERIIATLTASMPGSDPGQVAAAATAITDGLHGILWRSLAVAALAATLTGLVVSILLIREILRPLRELAASSRRIANGHYGERVKVPSSDELAMVATNFNEMADSLQQTEVQRVAMIGNVAHELRTPLTGLRGYLEGLLDGLFPSNQETFAHMYHEVRRLQRLVDDIQALSRVEAGQIQLDLQDFDLVPVLNQVLSQIRPQAHVQDLVVAVECDPASLLVYADRDRTAQVLMNLLGNALRYTGEGGRIDICVTTAGRVAGVAVRDTGVGIAADDLKHIFDRFYRADASRAGGGSGIGLTIARHLAWAMGGDLTAESDGPGQGSTFTLTLPLTAAN